MLTIVVQAGGESSRMGEDKALKTFLGRPLIQRVVERLTPIADEIIVTTNRPEAYGFLNLRLIPDIKPGRGALGGLYTAIASATHPIVAVIAWFPQVKVRVLTPEEIKAADPDGLAFWNVNTPEEFVKAEEIARQ